VWEAGVPAVVPFFDPNRGASSKRGRAQQTVDQAAGTTDEEDAPQRGTIEASKLHVVARSGSAPLFHELSARGAWRSELMQYRRLDCRTTGARGR